MSQNWWIEVKSLKENRIFIVFQTWSSTKLYQLVSGSCRKCITDEFKLIFFFFEIVTDFKKSLVSVKYLKSIDPVCKLKKNLSAKKFFTKFLESHTWVFEC